MAGRSVIGYLGGKSFFLQTPAEEFSGQAEENRQQRHTNDHTHKAIQSAEEENGKDDPHGTQTGGLSQDSRTQDIAVKLLKHQHEQGKAQRLGGTAADEHQQNTGDGTDKGAEIRDDVGHAPR